MAVLMFNVAPRHCAPTTGTCSPFTGIIHGENKQPGCFFEGRGGQVILHEDVGHAKRCFAEIISNRTKPDLTHISY